MDQLWTDPVGCADRARRPLQSGVAGRGGGGRDSGRLPLLLPQVDFSVSLPLVAPGKFPAAEVAGKRLLSRVRADVRGEVVAAAEVAHTYPTLERLVSSVDANVSGQFVGAREPAVAALRGTGVRPFVDRCLAGSVRVLSGPQDRPQGQVLWAVGRWEPGKRPSIGATTRTAQLKVPDSVQRGQGWRDAERIEWAWAERFPILDTCRVHVPLASRLEEARVVGDDGEKPRRV